MSTLVLRLAAPLQAWGSASRFTRRATEAAPTKSGVIGLLAAADGRRRTDSIEDLVGLRFGVRIDQPGRLVRDFQTARSLDGTSTMPLSTRFYLGDAVFVAAVEGGDRLVGHLRDALRHPHFPLFLGRRSCPPARPVLIEVSKNDLETTLRDVPWQAAEWYRMKNRRQATMRLRTLVDAISPSPDAETFRDQPVAHGFDPRHRDYGWRAVTGSEITVTNPECRSVSDRGTTGHTPGVFDEE